MLKIDEKLQIRCLNLFQVKEVLEDLDSLGFKIRYDNISEDLFIEYDIILQKFINYSKVMVTPTSYLINYSEFKRIFNKRYKQKKR